MGKQLVVATLDYETDPFKYNRIPKEFCCGFFDGTRYWEFWGDDCTQQFLKFLDTYVVEILNDNEELVIYAHNGGKFDFFYLLDYLDPDLSMINGRIAKAKMFGGKVTFLDSWLILPLPLSAHEKDSISYGKFERELRANHKKEILKYLKKDCTSLHEWVLMFRNQFGNKLTLASAAFAQLKQTSYKLENTFEEYDERFRNFYYGGRVQCFEVGAFKEDFEYVDINSAYPFAMLHSHWSGSRFIESTKIPEGDNGSWFVELDAVSKGALPFRGDDNRLYFPDDNKIRRYLVSGWEIISGLKTGTLNIKKVINVYRPLFKQNFEEYVNKFSKMKNEADINLRSAKKEGNETNIKYWSAMRQFAKLMLNSCYGKFGQDGRKFEKFTILEYGDYPDGEGWTPYSETNNHSIFSRPDPSNRFYNVATAASVTGWVRAYLWEAINASERPLYCDTDSIICQKFHGDMGTALGQWDLEETGTEAYIAQRKMYGLKIHDGNDGFKHKVASKGVKLTFEQIKAGVLSGQTIKTEREAPAFSLKFCETEKSKFGARFFTRKTNFGNTEKNSLRNPN